MKISDLSGEKKSDSEFLSYNLMLNSGQKNKYSNSRAVRKKILNETKNHNPPPCKLNAGAHPPPPNLKSWIRP